VNALRDENDQPFISSKYRSNTDGINTRKMIMNTPLNGERSKSLIPHFMLTFEIFNRNLYNCLMDYGASSNVMSYYVCKKLNATPTNCSTHIIQLNIYEVKLIE
jgi:hypothetical protein